MVVVVVVVAAVDVVVVVVCLFVCLFVCLLRHKVSHGGSFVHQHLESLYDDLWLCSHSHKTLQSCSSHAPVRQVWMPEKYIPLFKRAAT